MEEPLLVASERKVIESPRAMAFDDVSGAGFCDATGGVAIDYGPGCEPQRDSREGHADRHEARSQEVVQTIGQEDRLIPTSRSTTASPVRQIVRPVHIVVDDHRDL